MSILSEKDLTFIQNLRQAGVLADVEGRQLDLRNGVIMVACADGDQIWDIFNYQAEIGSSQRDEHRIHPLLLNGGALLIPEGSPLATDSDDKIMLKNIRQAIELKGITTIVLYVHAPCGAAGLCNLDMEQVIHLLMSAKERLKNTFTDLTVACFCHVDYPDESRKRTYFVSKDKWRQYNS